MAKNKDIEIEEIEYEEEGENSSDKLKKLREKLKQCQKEKDEYLDGWQRAKADFINARKEDEKRREQFTKFSNELLITELLTVLDSFDLAQKNSEDKAFSLIKGQMEGVLKNEGLEAIKTEGEEFNPELHEAVEEVESDKEEGLIIEEVQKGYILNGKVIRAARVKISK